MTDPLGEGTRLDLTVGPVAHGGHCVARVGGPHGQVVFVRHALPGEQVVAEVTEVHRGYLRADAVTIVTASPDRVEPPCPWAAPGRCGGCDLQHVTPSAQLDWKASVVREQLNRLAGLDVDVVVRPLPGGPLGWRTRIRYTVDARDRAGLLKHRSHEVVPIDHCRIAHPSLQALDLTARPWPSAEAVAAVASSTGDIAVLLPGSAATDVLDELSGGPILSGPSSVREHAAGRDWTLPATGFWQIHPAAADTLTAAVLDLLDPRPGETSWDLYGGAGLFAGALATRTGARVTLVESHPPAVDAARANLADLPQVECIAARVDTALSRRRITAPVDLVVLDPPRTGAGAEVVRHIAAAGPRAVAYVACDPAALARDVGTFREAGWRLAALRAYDCFPMTHHVECVALLVPGPR